MNLERIIDRLDNDPLIYKLSFNGILVWPLFRMKVLQKIIDTENNLDAARVPVEMSAFQKLRLIVSASTKAPMFGPAKPILFMNSALSTIKDKQGVYFNRVCDHFFSLVSDKAWMVEEANNFSHPHPRNHCIYSKLPYAIYMEIVARLYLRFNKRAAAEARRCGKQLQALISTHLGEEGLTASISVVNGFGEEFARHLLRATPLFKLYKRLFERKKVKVLIVEDGHYGSDNAIIIAAAHAQHAKVFEPQHGFLNQQHPAYNFGEVLRKDDMVKQYYPDVLMTYGKFWNLGANIPGTVSDIGNPHLEVLLKTTSEKKKKILVLGSGVTIAETQDVLRLLVEHNDGRYAICYRPHPQEMAAHLTRYEQQYEQGIIIDDQELYKSLAESTIVVGELTTALFEAVLFCNKVFLFRSSYTNAYYRPEIRYFNEFSLDNVISVFSDVTIDGSAAADYYWTMGFEEKFRQAIAVA